MLTGYSAATRVRFLSLTLLIFVFQEMKVKGYACVSQTHNTHVQIVEFTEDMLKIRLKARKRFSGKIYLLVMKIDGSHARNYWWPHVAMVTAFEHLWSRKDFINLISCVCQDS
jgi:hypothetical protein